MNTLVLMYVILVGALLWAELASKRPAQIVLKPLAASWFVLLAVYAGAFDSNFGQLVLIALLSCAAGDVLLLARDKPTLFKLGMVAFALGHLLFAMAFAQQPINIGSAYLPLAVLAVVAWIVLKYLRPHLPAEMLIPVTIYVGVITAMVAMAFATEQWILILAAILFAISDIFVARDRFVCPDAKNALIITPLYFAAQALFALSITNG